MWATKQCGAAFATLLLLGPVAATTEQQKPLLGSHVSQETANSFASSTSPWRLNFSSTAPYLFSSVSSLLQQWGNTFFPNGHNIVPCEIPAYTLFYHGRLDGDQPPSPEWLAFDMYGGHNFHHDSSSANTAKTEKCRMESWEAQEIRTCSLTKRPSP
jgi:hypothetical protein